MKKKLSIIIPVYNVELYIEKCLRSCAEQDIPAEKYEIIVINDGSKDNSLQIITKVIADYSNIILINKPNGGVSSARNAGLNIAKGEYVWFVDSDDWIASNCLYRLLSQIVNDQLDVMQIGLNIVNSDELLTTYNNKILETIVLSNERYINGMHFDGHCVSSIFRKSISVEYDIKFNESLIYFEDAVFFLNIMHYSKKIKKINYSPYFYKQRIDSATSLYREQEYFSCMNLYLKHSPLLNYSNFHQREICWVILNYIRISKINFLGLYIILKRNGYKRIPLLADALILNIILFIYNCNRPIGILFFKIKYFASNTKSNLAQFIKNP